MVYHLVEDIAVENAIIRDLGLDAKKIETEFGSVAKFFHHRIHGPLFHELMDRYGEQHHPHTGVIEALQWLQSQGCKLSAVTARHEFLRDIDKKTKQIVHSYFGDIPVHRVNSTAEKVPYLKEAAAVVDDHYLKLLDHFSERNKDEHEVLIVKRLTPYNKDWESHEEIVDVYDPAKQDWKHSVLEHCKKVGNMHIVTDLDDTVFAWRAIIHEAVEHYVKAYEEEVQRLRL